MAIIVEEEKSKVNLVSLGGWLGIVVLIGVIVYYVFFAAPELVVIAPPASFQAITPISGANLHPEDVLNSQAFTTLKPPPFPLPTPQGPTPVGRPDPFLFP